MGGDFEISRVVTTRDETQATYDRIAPIYELVEGFWERRARNAGLAALAAQPGESVFEIGSGPGHTMVDLARMVGPLGRVIGLDLSSNMCRLALRRLQRHAVLGACGVVQGDAIGLPFLAQSFDAGFLSFTLELFDTPEISEVLSECRRVLRPGGRMGVVALQKLQPGTRMQRAYEWGHDRLPRVLDCRPIHAGAALTDAGFSVVNERGLTLWGLPVAVLVARAPTG
jgi:demethylmenaquinone methyltransferase/2-methoxy-6-polyprenyl-1,4-benzoquinol methylase